MVNILRSFGGYSQGGPVFIQAPAAPALVQPARFTAGLSAYPNVTNPLPPDTPPSVAPLWQVDWTRDTALPGQLSLSRTSSALYYAKSGYRVSAPSSGPRIEYNPATGGAWGLLLEEQRTNQCLNSDDVTAASYIAGAAISASASTTKGADGVSNMTLLSISATTTGHSRYSNVTTVAAGVNSAIAMDVKFTNWNYIYINIISNNAGHWVTRIFDFTTGAFTETSLGTSSGTLVSDSVIPLGRGIYRIGMVASVNDPTTSNRYFQFGHASFATGNTYTPVNLGAPTGSSFAGTETYLCQCVDVQAGDYQTSHIATTSAAVTRSADLLSTTDSGLLAATGWEVETGDVTLAASQAGTLMGVNTVVGLGITSTGAITTADGGAQTTADTATWTGNNRAGIAWTP
jgi:hypothetical protein